MGISTLHSYRGAQIFEAIGLNREVIDRYFTWTASRIEGIGLDVIAGEAQERHDHAYKVSPALDGDLWVGGQYQWRRRGEHHMYNPNTIAKLQHAVRAGSYKMFKEYTALANDESRRLCTIRGLLRFKPGAAHPARRGRAGVGDREALQDRRHVARLDQPRGAREPRHRDEPPRRQVEHRRGRRGPGALPAATRTATSRRSAIKQVASGRFGVTSYYLVNADELQIKMAQGAKPGEGGQLPGHKVDEYIARIRYSTPGVGLISPPPHHDIYSIEDLAQLIHDLKNSNDRARISVKLVAEVGVGTVAAGVSKAKADVVLISGYEGGTGASPLTSIKHAGIPWELGLAETQQILVANDLRGRIRVRDRRPAEDRPRRRGRGAARRRGVRLRLGRARRVGLHHDARLPPEHLPGRHRHAGPAAAQEVRGQARARRPLHDLRRRGAARDHGGAGLPHRRRDGRPRRRARRARRRRPLEGDGRRPLRHPAQARRARRRSPSAASQPQDHGLEKALDNMLIERCRPALERRERVAARPADPQRQPHRLHDAVGRGVAPARRSRACPRTPSRSRFTGSAGQSFCAWLAPGIERRGRGRRQRLLRQGALGRPRRGLPAAHAPPSSPRTTSSSATCRSTAPPAARSSCAARPASASACATAASPRWSRAWATTAAST